MTAKGKVKGRPKVKVKPKAKVKVMAQRTERYK